MSQYTDMQVVFIEREQAILQSVEVSDDGPAADEISGTTLYSLISVGTELATYHGDQFPAYVGYAAVIQVDRTGDGVSAIKPGDLVMCMCPHRLHQRVKADKVVVVPRGLDPRHALFARMMVISMTSLNTTWACPSDLVAVTGLGLVGNLAAQIFSVCGHEVIACDPLAERRELADLSGIPRVYERLPIDDIELAGKFGLVAECSGHEQAVLDACKIVKKGGEVVLIGVPWSRRTDLFAHDILYQVFLRYVTLRSGWEWELPVDPSPFRPGSIMENMALAIRWLSEGRIKVDHLYQIASPNEVGDVYRSLSENKGKPLTFIFDWRSL